MRGGLGRSGSLAGAECGRVAEPQLAGPSHLVRAGQSGPALQATCGRVAEPQLAGVETENPQALLHLGEVCTPNGI